MTSNKVRKLNFRKKSFYCYYFHSTDLCIEDKNTTTVCPLRSFSIIIICLYFLVLFAL